MTFIWSIVVLLDTAVWLLPSPVDQFGWGLRIQTLDVIQPLLVEEAIAQRGFRVVLVNQTQKSREYVPLEVSISSRELDIQIYDAKGRPLRSTGTAYIPNTVVSRQQVPAKQCIHSSFDFAILGYSSLPASGEYELRATLLIGSDKITAPPFKFTVIDPHQDSIQHSIPVPLVGHQAKWPKQQQERAVIEQIWIANRLWLFYRRFNSLQNGGQVFHAVRLCELPSKCDLTVEGSVGEWKPISIVYQSSTQKTTKIVINSNSGTPWADPLPLPTAPPPRLIVKP